MSYAPVVPPLPHDFNAPTRQNSRPPLPPLPPNFTPERPVAAPMPERAMPSLPADMARSLDDSLDYPSPHRASSLYPTPSYPNHDPFRRPSPAPQHTLPPGAGYPGGFARPPSTYQPAPYPGGGSTAGYPPNGYGAPPPRTGPSPAPYGPPRMGPSPAPYSQHPGHLSAQYSLPTAMAGLSLAPQPHAVPPPRASSAQPYPQSPPQGQYAPHPRAQSQQAVYSHAYAQPPPHALGYAQPPQQGYTHPPPQGYPHSPPQGYPHSPPQQQQQMYPASPPTTSPQPGGPPELTAPLPTTDTLTSAQRALPPQPAPQHVPFIRDVLFLVDRVVAQQHAATPTDTSGAAPAPAHGAVSLPDPTLARLATDAIHLLLAVLAPAPPTPLPPHLAEAHYLRGTLHASGAFPTLVPPSPRDAFRDFELAARAGFQRAWFKLGRDYEAVGDAARARDCFDRGVRGGVESCVYRMGMARLLGQLALPASVGDALPLLQRAATLASTDVPQPAYVYGLILLGEFSHVRVEDRVIAAFVPPGGTPVGEARKWVERAAYLGFAPAQYKVGHAYEYAVAPFPFDPLLSVQYYSLASQQGEPEADMALSKWFLCGAEGAFEKDEGLAVTFADKAARKGLGSAEFAMGYYAEVGVGGRKDVDAARRWYAKAVDHGNADAPARLAALSQPQPQPLSRTEHDQITDVKLVRKRTQAKMSAAAEGRHAATASAGDGGAGMSAAQRVVESVRAQEGRGAAGGAGAGAGLEGVAEALEEEERGRESTVSPVQYQHTVNPPTPHSPPPQHAPHAFHPPQNAPSNLSPHAHQGPGPAQAQGYHSPPPPQQQGPQGGAGPQLQYANPSQPRYSLVDGPAPAGSGTPPLNPHRAPSAGAGGGRAAGRPPGRRQGSMGTPGGAGAAQAHAGGEYGAPGPGANGGGPSPGAGGGFGVPHAPAPAAAGPATFAEMGFQTGKAQEKECVIM